MWRYIEWSGLNAIVWFLFYVPYSWVQISNVVINQVNCRSVLQRGRWWVSECLLLRLAVWYCRCWRRSGLSARLCAVLNNIAEFATFLRHFKVRMLKNLLMNCNLINLIIRRTETVISYCRHFSRDSHLLMLIIEH